METYHKMAEIYDHIIGEVAFSSWLENFQRLCQAFHLPLSLCADIACGTGLVAAYLASQGAYVYAVDPSEEMLRIARERCRSLQVSFLRQDFLNLELPEKVDLLTCNTDSLNYLLVTEELGQALHNFRRAVKEGGYILFDMNTIFQLKGAADTEEWVMEDEGIRLLWRYSYDEGENVATLRMENFFLEDGEYHLYQEVHRERGYTLETITQVLREQGFREIYAWDFAGLGPISLYTRRYQLLAKAG
jgi:ubiquinone/menaquinone biosynthesis C-methylase UbiE